MILALALARAGLTGSCESALYVLWLILKNRYSKFDDPDREERALYAKYWQNKLKDNDKISYPDQLVDEVADATDHFSFAYLKEALCVHHIPCYILTA